MTEEDEDAASEDGHGYGEAADDGKHAPDIHTFHGRIMISTFVPAIMVLLL